LTEESGCLMEKLGRMALLYDLYGNLLTEKQREVLTLFYDEDLSLGEIADLWDISRQGVHDLLKRCEKLLEHYEERLQLLARLEANRKLINEMNGLLRQAKAEKRWDLVDTALALLAAKGQDL